MCLPFCLDKVFEAEGGGGAYANVAKRPPLA